MNKRETRSLHTGGGGLDGLLTGPDSKRFATFGDDRVELWDLATGQVVRSWPVFGVRSLVFTPDSRRLLAGLEESTLFLLEAP